MSRPQPTIAVKESRDDLLGIGPSTGLRGGCYGLVYVIGKGLYRWRSGDQSSNVPGSNDSDSWVAPSEDTSGKSGAWNLESPQVNDPEHATDSGTDTFVSATNTGTPGDGVKITRDFQSANTTTTPTLDGKTMTTRDGSALWAGAVSGVHELQYDLGADTYLVLNLKEAIVGAVNVQWFGAVGDGATDDTAAIQSALDTGEPVIFPDGSFACSLLTQNTDGQRIYGTGNTRLIKNANGDHFTSSGDDVQIHGVGFRGDAATPSFTGDGIVSTGDHFSLFNCGSRWVSGRAVKATGNHFQLIGQCDIYRTTDATATGYDIEVGVSGTATLYHKILGLYTSSSDGGVLLIDTGNAVLSGGQFGKLKIEAGTQPAGVNGGHTVGCRILGPVDVEQSFAVFSSNQFGSSANITFASGTSGCRLDESNVISSGATVTNNGNSNSVIVRQIGTGSPTPGTILQYGDDSETQGVIYSQHVNIENNQRLRGVKAAGGSFVNLIGLNASDTVTVGTTGDALSLNGGGQIDVAVDGTTNGRFDNDSTAGNTRLLLWDIDTGALVRVSVGANDSGGSGFKVLRIPN